MRTLAFDGHSGASGDMILGALLAAGADPDVLAPVEAALDLEYLVSRVDRAGIAATAVDVVPAGEADHPLEGHGHHRHYDEVVDVVEGLGLPADVTSSALAIFERLGEAEARVHGTELAETHFHEVGADDAIADVVGACLLVADLDVERILTTPLATGSGTVEMAHGVYSVPPPAVVELAGQADWAIQGGPVEAELLTPTGAAILAELADGVETLPALRVLATGSGAGDHDFASHPNVLRAVLGTTQDDLRSEEITVLETAVDDVSPEVLGGLQDALAPVGARDVSIVPQTMKKSRPGHLITVVCRPADAQQVARRLAHETGTLGVRERSASHRWVAERRVETVSVTVDGSAHEVDVKVGTEADGTVFDVSAEYDDARAVAEATGRPIREIQRLAEAAYRDA